MADSTRSPSCAPRTDTQPTAAERVPVGISPGFTVLTEPLDDLRDDLDAVVRLGVRRIRVDLSWAALQPAPDRFDWSSADRVLGEADDRGLEVLAVVGFLPDWARRTDAEGRSLPADPAAFADFVGQAAQRYRDLVGAWEIWNEPNTRSFWGADPDPAAYAALVAATAPVIRGADPGAPVVIGSIAPADDAVTELSPATFVRGLYDHLDPVHFDALSVHPYSYPAQATGTQRWNTFFRLAEVHRIMVRQGDRGVPIWLTEYGAPTGTSAVGLSEEAQAEMVVTGIREARSRPYVGPIYVYSLRDAGADRTEPEQNFGVLRSDGFPKSVVRALAATAATSCSVIAPR